VLSGTPTVSGTFPISFDAGNGFGSDSIQSFTLTVDAIPAITSASSTSFTEGTAGSFNVTATGFPAPTITESGALPTGVTYSGGLLSGTPTVSGTFPITFDAGNGIGPDAIQSFTLTVNAVPAITSAASTSFTEGTAGSFTVTATGFPTPTITESGALPAGVTYSDGVLSGTPTVSGTFPVSFDAGNGVGPDSIQSFTLTVINPSFHIVNTTLSSAIVGVPYTDQLSVSSGGQAPYKWKATKTLPSGLKLSSTGEITGTPSVKKAAPGNYTVTVTVTDHTKPTANVATTDFTLVLQAQPTFTSAASATFVGGASNTFHVVAAGSPSPTVTESGALPAGVTYSDGVLSGTPTQTGTFPVTFTAANGVGTDAQQSFTLSILEITTTSLPAGTAGTAYSTQLAATGGATPYKWSGQSLPSGFKLSSGGLLTAKASALTAGNYTITVQLADHEKPAVVATATFTLTVS
jgi:hypothetical protein